MNFLRKCQDRFVKYWQWFLIFGKFNVSAGFQRIRNAQTLGHNPMNKVVAAVKVWFG